MKCDGSYYEPVQAFTDEQEAYIFQKERDSKDFYFSYDVKEIELHEPTKLEKELK